jgi:malate dehydrogenase (oxaloacetate-decarboxylating)(NADP+)
MPIILISRFVDSKGLVAHNRGDKLSEHKVYFARPEPHAPRLTDLLDVIEYVKPTGLFGLSTVGGAFTKDVVCKLAELNGRPVIFPLSNPVSKVCDRGTYCDMSAEFCGRASAHLSKRSNGPTVASCLPPARRLNLSYTRARNILLVRGTTSMFSQVPSVTSALRHERFHTSRADAYGRLSGIGFGSILAGVTSIPDNIMHTAARALANSLTQHERDTLHLLYPALDRIRDVTVTIAKEIVREAQKLVRLIQSALLYMRLALTLVFRA